MPSLLFLYTAAVQLPVLQIFVALTHIGTGPSEEFVVVCTRCCGILVECISTMHPDVKLQMKHKVPLFKNSSPVPPVSPGKSAVI